MAIICVGGMISLGKSSMAKLLGETLKSEVFYESVDNNPVLERFYTASKEEAEAERLTFLLQLWFLNTRFDSIKKALIHSHNVLDRSIYEDIYFMKRNQQYGRLIGENRITDLEETIYMGLFENMMEELEELQKKSPDLMVYLKGSFETVIKRIKQRGREFELDEKLIEYYRFLWEEYDEWVMKHYKASEVLIIDVDNLDYVHNEKDKEYVVKLVKEKLEELGI